MVSNVIAFVAGPNDDPSSVSSGEIVECDSDCSQCCPENRSISMNESRGEDAVPICSKGSSSSKASQQSGMKRRKQNSDEGESVENKENEMIDIQNRSKRTSKAVEDVSKRGKCLL